MHELVIKYVYSYIIEIKLTHTWTRQIQYDQDAQDASLKTPYQDTCPQDGAPLHVTNIITIHILFHLNV